MLILSYYSLSISFIATPFLPFQGEKMQLKPYTPKTTLSGGF